MAGQCTPHSLFVLDKKRTGRARSKRKNRLGGSVCASANAPAAGGGRLALPPFGADETRGPCGDLWPGEGPDTPCFYPRCRCLGSGGGMGSYRGPGRFAAGPMAAPFGRPRKRRGSGSGDRRTGDPGPPRGFRRTGSRGSGEAKLPEFTAPGRRALVFVGNDAEDPRI